MPNSAIAQSSAILNSHFIAVMAVKDRHVVWGNAALHRIYGYAPDELIGKPTRLFFPDQASYEGFGQELYEALEQSRTYSCTALQMRKDGSRGWFEFNISRLEDYPDTVVGAIVDRTENYNLSVQLKASEERYRSVVEDQTEVISRILPDGTFVFVNEVYCRLFGKTADELIGKLWHPVAYPDDLPMIGAKLQEMSPDCPVVTIENRVFVASGELRWMQFANRGFFDADGHLVEIQSVGRDITSLKEAEAALRENQATLERAQSVARIGSFALGSGTDRFVHTKETARLFDLDEQCETNFAEWISRVHPDDQAAVEAAWRTALQGNPYDMTYRIVVRGQVIWIRALAELTFDAHGKLVYAVGTVQDITDQKRIEDSLRESEESLRYAMEAAQAGSWDVNLATGEFLASERMLEIYGLPPGTVMTHELATSSVFAPDQQKVESALRQAVETGEILRLEYRILHRDGSLHWVESCAVARRGDGLSRMSGFVREITDRKTAEEQLAKSRTQLELALSGADLGTWDTDIASRRSIYDERYCAMLGYKVNEIEPSMDAWLNLVHPDDLAAVNEAVRAHLAGETEIFEVEHRLRHKNGHWVWVLARGKVTYDANGHPIRASGTHQNISNRKRVSTEGADLLQRIQQLISGLDAHHDRPLGSMPASTPNQARLSGRNREILHLIAEGRTAAQIAEELGISESTAKTHRRNLMRKLGLNNKADLIRYAIKQGIVKA